MAGVTWQACQAGTRPASTLAAMASTKVVASIDTSRWIRSLKPVGFTLRGTYYGDVNEPGTSEDRDIHTGKKFITDIEARFDVADQFHFGLGVDNVFDVYPDRTPAALLSSTGVVSYPFYSPFGFNGRYLYAKVGVDW